MYYTIQKQSYRIFNKPIEHHINKELINNHIKLARWGVQSYLAGVDSIKLGYVGRNNLKSNENHTLYGFHDINPKELLSFTNFNDLIGWGIIKQIYDKLSNYEDGRFLIPKVLTGTKYLIRLYRYEVGLEK